MSKASYGYLFNSNRLRNGTILLPIICEGQPNWQFMEDYIKQEQKVQAQQVIDYYERKLVELSGDVVGLDKVKWKEFLLSDLFDFKRGNQNNMAKTQEGGLPLVSAKKFDNGVKAFISDNEKTLFEGNMLTLNNDGDGGVGIAYYQPSKVALDTHVTALIPKMDLDKFALLFISRSITEQREKFSHGYSLNNNRLLAQKIMLPAEKNGNPDFQYMSDFVKKLELDKVQEVLEYIYIYIYIKLKTMLKEKVCEISWKDFWIEDICDVKSGVRLTKANQEVGERPFIGASDSDNGVTAFVSNTNKSLDEDVLGVNYNGSVVENFYHPYQAIFSDDVKRVKWKDEAKGSKYTYLFLKQMILSQKIKYAYGYKFNGERMKRQKIMLPVTEAGLPDYDYMKSYMQKQELEQIFNILNYLYKNK